MLLLELLDNLVSSVFAKQSDDSTQAHFLGPVLSHHQWKLVRGAWS